MCHHIFRYIFTLFSKNGDVVYGRPTHVNKLVIANGEIIFDKVERDMNHSTKHLHNLQKQTKNRSKNWKKLWKCSKIVAKYQLLNVVVSNSTLSKIIQLSIYKFSLIFNLIFDLLFL